MKTENKLLINIVILSFFIMTGLSKNNYSYNDNGRIIIPNNDEISEFPKDGGGHHNAHIHSNNHVSGFFYLKVDKDGSFPVFHDPRPAALSSALPQKDKEIITYASESFHWKPEPGTLIIMPAYLNHEYVVSKDDPFRFIHFNLQAIENRFFKNE